MTRFDAICFGEVLWDLFEIAPDTYLRTLGGAPANVATVLARTGGRSALCGAVGRDMHGRALRARLQDAGVDVTLLTDRQERTGLTFVTRDAAGEPSFCFYRYHSADMSHAPKDLPEHLPAAKFAVVGTSTLVPGTLVRATTEAFLQKVQDASIALVVDLNVRRHLWKDLADLRAVVDSLLAKASVVKASEADFAALGCSESLTETAPQATWFVTRGGAGATVFPGGDHAAQFSVPTTPRPCLDATGAGDAFLAGVLSVLAKGDDGSPSTLRKAAERGHLLGGEAVTALGGTSAFEPPGDR